MDESLKVLLQSDTLFSHDIDDLFDSLAKVLLNKCVIKVGAKTYRMLEIEFYLYSLKHQDLITYPRIDKGGNWFFHQSGVDICFKSSLKPPVDGKFFLDESSKFGGILVRSIVEVDKDLNYMINTKPVHGPMKCLDALFKTFGAFDNNRYVSQIPYIAEYPSIKEEIIMQTQRYIPIKDGARNKIKSVLSSTYLNEEKDVDVKSAIEFIKEDSSYLYRYYIEPQEVKIWSNYKAKPQNGKRIE